MKTQKLTIRSVIAFSALALGAAGCNYTGTRGNPDADTAIVEVGTTTAAPADTTATPQTAAPDATIGGGSTSTGAASGTGAQTSSGAAGSSTSRTGEYRTGGR